MQAPSSVVRRRRQSTSLNTFYSETTQPIVTKFLRSGERENVQIALKGRGWERKNLLFKRSGPHDQARPPRSYFVKKKKV